MPANLPVPLLLLLHDGGWDEVIMVAAGLVVAYFVIVWTGRCGRDDVDEDGLYDDGVDASDSSSASASDQPPRKRP